MVRSVYRTDFEPLVLPREHIGVFYAGKWEWYRVEYVDSILPFRINFGNIAANGYTTRIDLSEHIGDPEENTMLELLINPIDDIELELYNPAAIPLHYVSDVTGSTKVQKATAEHNTAVSITATGVQGPIWQVTTNRVARIERIAIYNGATADALVYLCAADGTRLSATYVVPTGQTTILDKLNFEFSQDIYINTDQQPLNIDIKVVEKTLSNYKHLAVLYGMQNRMPSVIVRNPTKYDTPTSIVEFSGYKYYLEPVDKEPDKWTFVPVGGFGGVLR